jgi:putative transposase
MQTRPTVTAPLQLYTRKIAGAKLTRMVVVCAHVELNPVRAGLVGAPSRYRWSSAAAHVRGQDDSLVEVAPLLKLAPNWRAFLARVLREEDIKLLRAHENTGRPLGDERSWRRLNKTWAGF